MWTGGQSGQTQSPPAGANPPPGAGQGEISRQEQTAIIYTFQNPFFLLQIMFVVCSSVLLRKDSQIETKFAV